MLTLHRCQHLLALLGFQGLVLRSLLVCSKHFSHSSQVLLFTSLLGHLPLSSVSGNFFPSFFLCQIVWMLLTFWMTYCTIQLRKPHTRPPARTLDGILKYRPTLPPIASRHSTSIRQLSPPPHNIAKTHSIFTSVLWGWTRGTRRPNQIHFKMVSTQTHIHRVPAAFRGRCKSPYVRIGGTPGVIHVGKQGFSTRLTETIPAKGSLLLVSQTCRLSSPCLSSLCSLPPTYPSHCIPINAPWV